MPSQNLWKMLPRMHQYNPIRDPASLEEKAVESLPTEEDTFLAREQHLAFQQQQSRHWRKFTFCLSGLVAGIILVFIALRIVQNDASPWATMLPRTPIPEFRTEVLLVRPHKDFEEPANPRSDQLWNSILPGGKGFLLVEDAHEFGLPPGMPSPDNGTGTYGVTWTHEFHCLKLLRSELWNAIDGTSELYGGYAADPPLQKMQARRLHHLQHCMDYIRQLILCRADMTIEWAAPYPDSVGNVDHIDGYDIPHKCTRWDDMYDYMMDLQPYPPEHYVQLHEEAVANGQ